MTRRLAKKPPLGEFLASKSVLVVEPSPNYRASIKQFLTNLQVKRQKAVSTAAEATRELMTTQVGLFIVEWNLDGQNGLQFCRQLRKDRKYATTPFLLLSVENLRTDVILASEVKVDGYLLKPFSFEDFCTQIATIIKAQTEPTRLDNLLEVGQRALARGELIDAEVAFNAALGLKDQSARALVGLGQLRHRQGNLREAMRYLHQAVTTNPDFIDGYRVMLEIYESIGNHEGLIQTATMLNTLSPNNPRYTLILAKAFLDQRHTDQAEVFFKQTISLSPRLAEAHKGLGHVYTAKDEHEKALKSFKKALDLDDQDIGTLNALGMSYIRLGHFKEGLDKYLMALKFDPSDYRVLFNVGHAYERHGDPQKARFYYQQALSHKTGYDKALRGLERLSPQAALKVAGDASLGQAPFDDDGEDF